jgi:c-di-GMP-binding flagellar brake protein YcgR
MESGAIQYIQTTSKVIRIREQENGRSNLLSIAYEKIQDKDREAIIRYCFENQLKNRRRGLS